MKILLMRPPIEGYHRVAAHSRSFPTGLMYLRHALQRQGIEVEIFDSLCWAGDTHVVPESALPGKTIERLRANPIFTSVIHHGADWRRIRDSIRKASPDLIGISCQFSSHCDTAYRTAFIAREEKPQIPIIMGGAHVSALYRDVLASSPVDAVLAGEAEESFPILASAICNGALESTGRSAIPGLVTRRDGNHRGPFSQAIVLDLDGLGFPTPTGPELSRYAGIASVVTSRGCPHSCAFCSIPALAGRRFRPRSSASVLDELKYYRRLGVRALNIEDDNFTADTGRADRIMEDICRAGLDLELRFPNGLSAATLTTERIHLLARAGVTELFIGLESSDPQTRRAIGKDFVSTEKAEDVVRTARACGISASASLITGLPVQTAQSMAGDLARVFAREIHSTPNAYYPLPGTRLFEYVQRRGYFDPRASSWGGPMSFDIETEHFTRSDAAAAFLIGTALADPILRPLHEEFLRGSSNPPPRRILSKLRSAGLLVSARNLDDLVLSPHECWCEEQDLTGKAPGNTASENGCCSLTGHLLCTALALWTHHGYRFRETFCSIVDASKRCTFHLQRTAEPPPRILTLFLDLVTAGCSGPAREDQAVRI